jgi:hypothetical protein
MCTIVFGNDWSYSTKKTCCGDCEGVDKHFNTTISEGIFVWNWLVFGVDDSCICGNNKTNMKIY